MGKKRTQLLSTQKFIDGDKVMAYIKEHDICQMEITDKMGVSHGYIRQAANRGYTSIGLWKLACEGMGVPEDYFDVVEAVPEPEPVQETPEEEKPDMADIQLSLNKIELILTKMFDIMEEQNRLLRGRLEKAERSSVPIGNTNSGQPHVFMTKKEHL